MSVAHEDVLRKPYDGYDAFLKKPFEMPAVLSAIRKLLPDESPARSRRPIRASKTGRSENI